MYILKILQIVVVYYKYDIYIVVYSNIYIYILQIVVYVHIKICNIYIYEYIIVWYIYIWIYAHIKHRWEFSFLNSSSLVIFDLARAQVLICKMLEIWCSRTCGSRADQPWLINPLVNSYMYVIYHHFQGVNPLFLWTFQ